MGYSWVLTTPSHSSSLWWVTYTRPVSAFQAFVPHAQAALREAARPLLPGGLPTDHHSLGRAPPASPAGMVQSARAVWPGSGRAGGTCWTNSSPPDSLSVHWPQPQSPNRPRMHWPPSCRRAPSVIKATSVPRPHPRGPLPLPRHRILAPALTAPSWARPPVPSSVAFPASQRSLLLQPPEPWPVPASGV